MSKVFVSHSNKDKYFVNLLIALMNFHEIKTWCSSKDLQGSEKYRKEIEKALDDADTLIVVISENSTNSKWVIKEIVQFQTKKPHAPILPLLLDSTELNEVVDGLERYQSIDFSKCHLTGFTNLTAVFNKKFLPKIEPISKDSMFADRRAERDRRAKNDRRTSDILKRLKIGFQLSYSRALGLGKFDFFQMLLDSLLVEAQKYIFVDENGETLNPQKVLEKSTKKILADVEIADPAHSVNIIEDIAEDIYHSYKIELIDKRKQSSRRLK